MDQARGIDDSRRGQSHSSKFLILLLIIIQRALGNQPWKEYTAEGGRKYWYNTETKQSSWEMPDVYKEAMSKEAHAPAPIPQ